MGFTTSVSKHSLFVVSGLWNFRRLLRAVSLHQNDMLQKTDLNLSAMISYLSVGCDRHLRNVKGAAVALGESKNDVRIRLFDGFPDAIHLRRVESKRISLIFLQYLLGNDKVIGPWGPRIT